MINREQLKTDLSVATGSLIGRFESYPDSLFHTAPDGKWSAAQIAEHLIKMESLVTKVLEGTKATSGRQGNEMALAITNRFSDRTTKISAPESIIPGDTIIPANELIGQLKQVRRHLFGIAAEADLEALCDSFDHRNFGKLTVYEWLQFVITHGERHTHQLFDTERALADTSIL